MGIEDKIEKLYSAVLIRKNGIAIKPYLNLEFGLGCPGRQRKDRVLEVITVMGSGCRFPFLEGLRDF